MSNKCDDCHCELTDAAGNWVECGYDQVTQQWVNVCVACSNKSKNGDSELDEIKVDLGGC